MHRLLDIGPAESAAMRQAILAGDEIAKPGFTRLNFSVLLPDDKVAFILDGVAKLASEAVDLAQHYDFDGSRAIFFPRAA